MNIKYGLITGHSFANIWVSVESKISYHINSNVNIFVLKSIDTGLFNPIFNNIRDFRHIVKHDVSGRNYEE